MTVSIIVPTRNEETNIKELILQLRPYGHEIIVVDDSTDNTAKIASDMGAIVIAGQHMGLGQAIVDGIKASDKDIVLVMDADLSHDPKYIPDLLNPILNHGYDMTIGSRNVAGGGSEDWSMARRIISIIAQLPARLLCPVKDTTGGYFAVRRDILKGIELAASSWKIMLEILVKANPSLVKEVPIMFRGRTSGKSKLSSKQMVYYMKHLVLLTYYRLSKMVKFGVAEAFGTVFILVLVWILTEIGGLWYMFSLVLATAIGFILKYKINSVWTFGKGLTPGTASYEWDSYYHGGMVQKWWKHRIANTVWEWIPNASRLLDIGCGSSPIISMYGDNATGIDANEQKIDFMRQKLPLTKFVAVDISRLHGSYDHILCIEVIEHLKDADTMIKHIARLLKSGGQAVIATPDYNRILWKLAERFTPYKEEHITQFNRRKLEDICKKHGMIPIKYKYVASCDLIEMFTKA